MSVRSNLLFGHPTQPKTNYITLPPKSLTLHRKEKETQKVQEEEDKNGCPNDGAQAINPTACAALNPIPVRVSSRRASPVRKHYSHHRRRVAIHFSSLGRRFSLRLSPGCRDPSTGSPICAERAYQAWKKSSHNL